MKSQMNPKTYDFLLKTLGHVDEDEMTEHDFL